MKTVIILFTIFAVALCNEQRISRKKCEEFNKLSQAENRCSAEQLKKYSFVTHLGYKNDDNEMKWTCSAVMVSPEYALTDAHCVINPLTMRNNTLYVRLGSSLVKVVEMTVHPEYKSREAYNDIALLKLESPASVTPACLYAGEGLEEYTVAGHYINRHNANLSDTLVSQVVTRAENSKCTERFKEYRRLSQGIKFDQHFCTNAAERSCESSIVSGAPFFNKDSDLQCMHNVAGLVAYGDNSCIGQLNLNVRLSPFVDWIESIVWKK